MATIKQARAMAEIISMIPAEEWKGFLFRAQNSLLQSGQFDSLTKKGASDICGKFGLLYEVFEIAGSAELQKVSKSCKKL